MDNELGVKKIGVVGCGVIGMSWTAYFLAKGFSVRATDPNPAAEARTREYVDNAWPLLERMGAAPGGKDRLFFSTDLIEAMDGVDFVQENGPERIDLKRTLFRDIANAIEPRVIVASSSSGIPVSDFQGASVHPERIVLGHPFNPPHVLPLVEVAGGKLTSPDVVDATVRFYARIGKKPVRMNREMKGHIANRIQAAVMREVLYLLAQDVASVEDLDIAIAHGPGMRWAILGQFLNADQGGGEGGIRHMMEHLGPAMEGWWADLGRNEHIAAEDIGLMERGVAKILERHDRAAIASARDRVLAQILQAKAAEDRLPY